MRRYSGAFAALAPVLILCLACGPAFACTWAFFALPEPKASDEAPEEAAVAVVGRTMDWEYSDEAVVWGVKAGARLYTAEAGRNPLPYTAKYASIQITSFAPDLVSEALNEKGLQGSVLYLEGARFPDCREDVPGVDPLRFIGYAVSMFDSAEQVVRFLEDGGVNFIHVVNPLVEGSRPSPHMPFHYAFADASGGRAIVEFMDGELKVYSDWSDNALTNEPSYDVHKTLESLRYRPGASISPIDRRARANLHLRDMYRSGKVVDTPTAMLAMRGLLASVFAGTEEIDRTMAEADPAKARRHVYPTQWWTVIDLGNPAYYLTRIDSWCVEIYDFSMVAAMEGEQGILSPERPSPLE